MNSGAGVAGTGESMTVSSSTLSSLSDNVEGLRTHCTESRRRDLDVSGVSGKLLGFFIGDIDFRAGIVDVLGRRVPLRFASARGSIDLRLRWPPRGTMAVSTK